MLIFGMGGMGAAQALRGTAVQPSGGGTVSTTFQRSSATTNFTAPASVWKPTPPPEPAPPANWTGTAAAGPKPPPPQFRPPVSSGVTGAVAQHFASGIPEGAIGTDIATGQPTIMGPGKKPVFLNTPEGQAILAAHQAGAEAIASVQASSPTSSPTYSAPAGGPGGEMVGGSSFGGQTPGPLILGRFTRKQVGIAAAGLAVLGLVVLVARR